MTFAIFALGRRYESMANNARSVIDHFMVSQNLAIHVKGISTDASIDNLSDHLVLCVALDVAPIRQSLEYVENEEKLLWACATESDVAQYKRNLNNELLSCNIPVDALSCRDHFCKDHTNDLQQFHDTIINACLSASVCIPTCSRKGRKMPVPGWSEFVKPYRDQAIFWHQLWQDNNSPRCGIIADIRRRTRTQYHKVLKNVQRNENDMRYYKLANSFGNGPSRDFWGEVKKLRGRSTRHPSNIDGVTGEQNITDLFSNKYKGLYNSVPYDVNQMKRLTNNISLDIVNHSCDHSVQFNDVTEAVRQLKIGKHDGNKGHFTNHLIHGPERLYCYISLLFDSLISHGVVPHDFLL